MKYSLKLDDEERIVKAMGRDMDISFKHAVLICDKLRGMRIKDAINILESVIKLERTIPFRRFNKGVGHRKGLKKDKISKYPVKASKNILKILRNLENNADYKGLDPDKLLIKHIQAQKGISRLRRKPRGRWALWKRQYVNIQIIAEEVNRELKEK